MQNATHSDAFPSKLAVIQLPWRWNIFRFCTGFRPQKLAEARLVVKPAYILVANFFNSRIAVGISGKLRL